MSAPTKTIGFRSTSRAWMTTKTESAPKWRFSPEGFTRNGKLPARLATSQNSPTLIAGLGSEKATDVVRLLWPKGVPQDEVNLQAGRVHLINELDRRGSSCPVLFSWNGREYEFIADMIGPA